MNTLDFVKESNRIEGIHRLPTAAEIDEHDRFVALPVITVADLEQFVSAYQPDAKLRTDPDVVVSVGGHIPPEGGMGVVYALEKLLEDIEGMTPYQAHVAYEALHPFTDGNGRSGRALWAWHMIETLGEYPLGFLHHFYYQSLDASRVEP